MDFELVKEPHKLARVRVEYAAVGEALRSMLVCTTMTRQSCVHRAAAVCGSVQLLCTKFKLVLLVAKS